MLSLLLMLATLLWGHVFFGWVCPLGSLGGALDALFRFPMRGRQLQSIKYCLLAAFATLALFGHAWVWTEQAQRAAHQARCLPGHAGRLFVLPRDESR